MLLGLLLAAIGSFVHMHHNEALSIRAQREAIKDGCLDAAVGGIDVFGGSGIDFSVGFVSKPKPPPIDQYISKDERQPLDSLCIVGLSCSCG